MVQYFDTTLTDDWEIVRVPAHLHSYAELRDWLKENIDNTPAYLLPYTLRFEYTASSSSWYIDIGDSPIIGDDNALLKLWKIGFKNVQDAVLFKLIWL